MKVIPLADASCPSCGVRGDIVPHVWHGKKIQVLTPTRIQGDSRPRYACLYLRPFASIFRAAGRMQAVARAMRPSGTPVALYGGEATFGLRRVKLGPAFVPFFRVVRVLGFIPYVQIVVTVFFTLPVGAFLLVVKLVEFVQRAIFRWHRIELVEVPDERWRQTFSQLAFHSHVIVMDVSTLTTGTNYEAEFIEDLKLAGRLLLLHEQSASARASAERLVARLQATGLHVPLVSYSRWRVHRLTKDLRALLPSRESIEAP